MLMRRWFLGSDDGFEPKARLVGHVLVIPHGLWLHPRCPQADLNRCLDLEEGLVLVYRLTKGPRYLRGLFVDTING